LRFQRSKRDWWSDGLISKEIHKPAKNKSSYDHQEKERKSVLYLASSFRSSDEGQDDADKSSIKNHGEKMAF
jgi:hypothetical protein